MRHQVDRPLMMGELYRTGLSSCLLLSAATALTCNAESEKPSEGSGGAGAGGASSCQTIEADYAAAIDEATVCHPSSGLDECTERIVEGLACSCPRYVNHENGDAVARVKETAAAYARNDCGAGIVCGPCEIHIAGRCSESGRCENVYSPDGRGCKVDGRVYSDGEGPIPDPVSCNTCTCEDGQLVCTEIHCPEPCPPESAYGTDCAECGPVDDCRVIEHACLPTCVDGCDGGTCSNGLCLRGLCG